MSKIVDYLLGAIVGFVVGIGLFSTIGKPEVLLYQPLAGGGYEQCRADFTRKTWCFEELSADSCLKLIDNLCGDP
jgi:hypothetical protein